MQIVYLKRIGFTRKQFQNKILSLQKKGGDYNGNYKNKQVFTIKHYDIYAVT